MVTTSTQRSLRTDYLVAGLIVAFTAVPIELRVPGQQVLREALSLDVYSIDVAANVLGYVPFGIVLRSRGAWSVFLISALLSVSSEVTQLFTVDRAPAVVDVAMNLVGAGLGLLASRRLRLVPEQITIEPVHALLAAAAAVTYVLVGSNFTVEGALRQVRVAFEAPPWMSTNQRGWAAPGTVETRLSFDRIDNDRIADASANRWRATAVNGPILSPGMMGSAISLNGKQWVDLDNPVALRMIGSMTLSAWIRPTAFPVDDAAIISSLTDDELGYQLDLTIDQGARTIGFKVANGSGPLMARYGKTPIATDRWYHVAGVYDAQSRTLDVYLNGMRDNGCLVGTITGTQLASNGHVFVGRRAGMAGFEFIGSIDEAVIESTAHPPTRVEGETDVASDVQVDAGGAAGMRDSVLDDQVCKEQPRPRIAGPLTLLGMLIALACMVLGSGMRYPLFSLGLCFVVGLTVPLWAPLSTLAGGPWLAIACVPLGGGIVLLANRQVGSTRDAQ